MTTPQIAAYRDDCIARQLDRTAVQCSGEALFAAQAESRENTEKGASGMKPTAKGVDVGGGLGGWMVYLWSIIAWAIHGAVAGVWTGFPEDAAVSLLMAGFTFAVYRAWPASDRGPPEPKQ